MVLSGRQEAAAALLAADRLPDHTIAEQVGYSVRKLAYLKHEPDFAARVDEVRAEIRERVRSTGIAVVENRVQRLDDTRNALLRVIEARSKDPSTLAEPGGETGLLAIVTVTKYGTPVYGVDTALLKELRAHEEQAAKELGQWIERKRVDGVQTIAITEIEVVLPEDDEA